jgi:enterochelin esterase-like enzyme
MNKYKLFLTPLSCLWLLMAFGQTTPKGTVLESISIPSTLLKQEMRFSIYLPPDYFASQRRYPVVYLLHGYSGRETDWVQFGEANRIIDKLIVDSQLPDVIVVMPDGRNDWYVNTFDGAVRYEDYFIKELVPHIDSNYQTRADRLFRATAGLSMGGYGATSLAMKYPEMFCAAAGLSAAYLTDEEMINMPDDRYNNTFQNIVGRNLKGKERVAGMWQQNSVFSLIEKKGDALKKIRWYFDCGDDDFLYKGNAQIHVLMSDKQIPHECRMRDGAHTWSYWRTALPDALLFIGQSFKH